MAAATEIPTSILADAAMRARTDPVWFAERILRLRALSGEKTLEQDPQDTWELDQWQRNLLEAVGDVVRKEYGVKTVINHDAINQISVRAMHGPGKTFGLAILLHWFNFCFPGVVPCTAPKLQQLKTRLWKEVRRIRYRAIPGYRDLMKVQGQKIVWLGPDGQWNENHTAFMETASAPENLAGLHDKYLMILVDEASGVDEALWPVIEGAISTGKIVLLVIISNPTKNTGTFADSHLRETVAKDWFQLHIRLQDTRRVKREWVRRMENKYGKGSPVVAVRCYGEFAADDENQLITLEWIADARNREFEEDGSFPRKRLSIDVADGGLDFSVATLGERYDSFRRLIKQKMYSFPKNKAQGMLFDEVERLWKYYDMSAAAGDDIVVDSLGVGAGLASMLSKEGYPVVFYKGGESSDDSKEWRNRRVQSYMVCRDDFSYGSISIDDDFVDDDEWDDVEGQLTSIRRKEGTESREDLLTKKEMREKNITSPDRADSIAMQYATQRPEVHAPFVIGTGGQTESSRYDGSISH